MLIEVLKKEFKEGLWNNRVFYFFFDTFNKMVEDIVTVKPQLIDADGNERVRLLGVWFYKNVNTRNVRNIINPFVFIFAICQKCLILFSYCVVIYSLLSQDFEYFGIVSWLVSISMIMMSYYEVWVRRKIKKFYQLNSDVSWVLGFLRYCFESNERIEFLKALILSDKLNAKEIKELPDECKPLIMISEEILNNNHWRKVELNLRNKYDLHLS